MPTNKLYLVMRTDAVTSNVTAKGILSSSHPKTPPDAIYDTYNFIDHAFATKHEALQYLKSALIANKNGQLKQEGKFDYTIDLYLAIIEPETKMPNPIDTNTSNNYVSIQYIGYKLDRNNKLVKKK